MRASDEKLVPLSEFFQKYYRKVRTVLTLDLEKGIRTGPRSV